MNRSVKRVLLSLTVTAVLCAGLLCGCSSQPDRTEILVGTTPPGASCILFRLGQPIATVAPTPGIALVEPAAGDITILCRRQGFEDAVLTLPVREAGPSFGTIVYGRSPYDYPPRVGIELRPRPSGTAPR